MCAGSLPMALAGHPEERQHLQKLLHLVGRSQSCLHSQGKTRQFSAKCRLFITPVGKVSSPGWEVTALCGLPWQQGQGSRSWEHWVC